MLVKFLSHHSQMHVGQAKEDPSVTVYSPKSTDGTQISTPGAIKLGWIKLRE